MSEPSSPAPPGAPSVPPTAVDPLARAGSEVLGGPAGRRLGGDGPWWARALPVAVFLTSAAIAVGVATRHHCRAQGWNTPDQFVHACYSDLPVVFTSSGLANGLGPYDDGVALNQPPVTAALAWLLARLAPHEVTVAAQRTYFDVSSVLLLLAALVVTVSVWATTGRGRGWDVLLVAVSPVLALSGLLSLDLAGVALATAGTACWARRRPVAAGVLLGLAVAARTYPVLVLLAIALLAVRTGRHRAAATTVLAAVLAWLAVDLPLALTRPGAWSAYLSAFFEQRAGYGSPWVLPQLAQQAVGAEGTSGLPGTAVVVLSVGAWIAWTALVGVFALWAPRRPRLPQVAFLLVAGCCALGVAFPPQASLWLLPLAVLAVPRWRDQVLWWAAEAAYYGAVWLYIAGQTNTDRALPPELYALFLLLRLAAVAWLVVCVVREARAPRRDAVRSTPGLDDPAGGDFDGAPDALVVRIG
ncbi:glycosyltransferase 87 family protein [Kineococcus radiotolerans]|uniref:Integral membrane protein n=1 Tax=Kineococcus radiotolerans (strain ATCC BAA-149 / DSM 14245 / SRS30216) TaxID=266940 RepID=A6WG64_KINRD|nr:glycosyltransferase 87 family protein [Kineococcus radiotolerans]ABS05803.1 integral membrane protein [Kineococcus radiotolerans SRS30216 = ATCC BAA-149]